MRCPNGSGTESFDESSPCSWTRKLCVSCFEQGGVVKVKVQTNGLPNHCINSTVNNAVANDLEWEVNFNPDMNGIENYKASDFDSSTKTDEILCDL